MELRDGEGDGVSSRKLIGAAWRRLTRRFEEDEYDSDDLAGDNFADDRFSDFVCSGVFFKIDLGVVTVDLDGPGDAEDTGFSGWYFLAAILVNFTEGLSFFAFVVFSSSITCTFPFLKITRCDQVGLSSRTAALRFFCGGELKISKSASVIA